MTQTQRSLSAAMRRALSLLLFAILISTGTAWAKNKNAAKERKPSAKAQTSRNDKRSRESSARNNKNSRDARDSRNSRDRSAKEARVDKRRDKNSARDL